MDRQPKTEPGSQPVFASTDHRNLKDMSIHDLVSVLRTAFRMEDYDRVEEVLVSRDARLKAENRSLREKAEMERLAKIQAEEEFIKREELVEEGKRAKESYEKLLKEVKSEFAERDTVGELRKKNSELECEVCELKKNWEDDSNTLAELRIRFSALEDEKNALGIKNSELEEASERHLATINELRIKNNKLFDEKNKFETLAECMERKFVELNGRVVKLEDDTRLLMSVDDGNTPASPGVTDNKDEDEEDDRDNEFGNGTGGLDLLQRNEDACHSFGVGTAHPTSKGSKDAALGGASGKGSLELKKGPEIIDLDDDDDDECTSRGLQGKKANSLVIMKNEHPCSSGEVRQKSLLKCAQMVEKVKRKFSFSRIDTSSSLSSSSADPVRNVKLRQTVLD